MNAIHSINPHRWNELFNKLNQDHGLVYLLDRIIYRWQNSTYAYNAKKVFSESLESLATFADYPSTRALQRDLKRLEKMGCITRKTISQVQGRRCLFELTPKITDLFPEREGRGPVFWQATNMKRYDALRDLLAKHSMTERMSVFVLDRLVYLCQRDANRVDCLLDTHAAPLTQPEIARHCHLSLRTLQRHIADLDSAGLIRKKRQRISSNLVETSYQINILVIATLRRAKPSKMLEYPTQDERKPYTTFGGSSSTIFGGSINNINKDTYKYNNTNNMGCVQNPTSSNDSYMVNVGTVNFQHEIEAKNAVSHVSRKTCSNNEQSGAASSPQIASELPLDTLLDGKTQLNARQRGYIRGMLQRLEKQHNCAFSNPTGLLEEIRYATQSVTKVFVGKTSFIHRVNIVAKLLRQKRWTTPHGFENYDEKGQEQKQRREERDKKWAEQKAAEGKEGACIAFLQHGERRNNGPPKPLSSFLPRAAAANTPPPEVIQRIEEMKRLVKRAESPDCSTEAKAQIVDLIQRHASDIKRIQNTAEVWIQRWEAV